MNMKKSLKILSLVLAIAMLLTLAAAASAEDVTLRMAVGYNNANTGLAFSPDIAGDGITAVEEFGKHPFDLVVLENVVPGSLTPYHLAGVAGEKLDHVYTGNC